MNLRWLVLIAAACGGDRTLAPPLREASVAPAAAAALRHAPHSGGIVLVAATEEGDAAFTIDDQGQGRLWPALDGMHEPVVVLAPPARDVVLVHHGDGMLAAVLDRAGGIELIRFAGDGAERGRTRLAPEPGFDDIDPLGDGVLALRRDQVVVELDAQGAVRASLAAAPGEHVRMIATRGGHVVAALAGDAPVPASTGVAAGLASAARSLRDVEARFADPGATIAAVRVVTTDAGLAWGAPHELREPLQGDVALSPSGTRLAGLSATESQAALIVDVATGEAKTFSQASALRADAFFGFLSDDVAIAVSGTIVRWWSVTPPPDLWTAMNYELQGDAQTIAATNGRAIGGRDTGLMLFNGERTRYLGYRHIANGGAFVAGGGGAITSSKHVTWFDRELREHAARTLPTAEEPDLVVLDDDHVLHVQHYVAGDRRESSVYLHGPSMSPPILLGTWRQVGTSGFDPSTGVIAIPTQGDSKAVIVRFELDRDAHTVRPLPSLQIDGTTIEQVVPLDPARADGAVAVAMGFADIGGSAVMQFTEASRDGRLDRFEDVYALGIDRTGHAYLADWKQRTLVLTSPRGVWDTIELEPPTYLEIAIARADAGAGSLGLPGVQGAVSDDGEVIVLYSSSRVIALDRRGKERWRLGRHTTAAAFFAGTHTLFLSSSAGLATIDGDTGKRLAVRCGFSFGLWTQLTSAQFARENLCSRDD